MNIKSCWACHTGVAFQPLTNGKGEILKTNSICRNPSCPLFTQNLTKLALKKKKSSLSSKRISKHSKPQSRLLQGTLVGLSSLVLTVTALTSLASADYTNSTETFVAPKTSSAPSQAPVVTKESIKEKILRYSLKYDVDPRELENIVKCETGSEDVNKASTTIQSRYLIGTPRRELSFGIVQLHISKLNGVTLENAYNVDYSLNYLAREWKAGNQWMWKNCSLKYGYL